MYSFVGWTLSIMSFLTLVLIAIERYLAIRLHLSYATTRTTKRILKIVTFIWVVVTVLTSIRFWDINEVFFRPTLITAASLSTGILVVCYTARYLYSFVDTGNRY